MARKVYGVANAIVEVEDITKLVEVCEQLDIGDLVAENKDGVKKLYRVSKRSESGLCLSYVDNESSNVVVYERASNGAWSYDETKETELGGSGGTQLYHHHYSNEDNTKYVDFVSTSETALTSADDIGTAFNHNEILKITAFDDDARIFANGAYVVVGSEDALTVGNEWDGDVELYVYELENVEITPL